MSEEIKKLKSIGAQKIYEDTHIALAYVHSVLNENFDGLSKVQFVGFISILEREYSLDLTSLREKGLMFFDNQEPDYSKSHGVFVTPQKKRKLTYVYLSIAVVIFLLVAFMSSSQEKESVKTAVVLDNKAIETAKQVIKPSPEINDVNETLKNNLTQEPEKPESMLVVEPVVKPTIEPVVEPVVEPEKVVIVKSLKIIPSTKVWIGFIQQDTRIKKQKVIAKALSLDPEKPWLLALGHGNIEIEINGKIKKFSSLESIRFSYKNGELKQLSIKEFKALNEGRLW
jgi:hypothetical protein